MMCVMELPMGIRYLLEKKRVIGVTLKWFHFYLCTIIDNSVFHVMAFFLQRNWSALGVPKGSICGTLFYLSSSMTSRFKLIVFFYILGSECNNVFISRMWNL